MNFLILFFSLFYTHFAYSGSYLFCVNKDNTSEWKWAPPNPKGLHSYMDIVPPDNRGTWLSGSAGVNNYMHIMLTTTHNKLIKEQAIDLCIKLKKICTDAYGEKYSYIGAAGYSVPNASWAHIYITYSCNRHLVDAEYFACPNWSLTAILDEY